MTQRSDETCASCGAQAETRENPEGATDADGRCCDDGGRGQLDDVDRALQQSVTDLLSQRSDGATICPSEAARAVGGEQWRSLMEPARAAARRLVAAGEVEVVQRGVVVDPSTAKGPIRIRRAR